MIGRMKPTALVLTAAAALGLGLAGCSSSSPQAQAQQALSSVAAQLPKPSPQSDLVYNQSQIVRDLGLKPLNLYGQNWSFGTPVPNKYDPNRGCTVIVVLGSAGDVSSYLGDPDVVTNPAKTAGVKVTGDEQATCNRELTAALAKLGPPR